ncbi:hypothetical protein [Streptomyces sp. MMBL 11-1]|uniref:hypothetical protein n=1 Tax=Streptomyces sp. MMBL 11-1 TaxID=3026420 RepID=UPI00235DFFAA|nr:hypothetical protein [Streptomyces sp. MMBL 11-1]
MAHPRSHLTETGRRQPSTAAHNGCLDHPSTKLPEGTTLRYYAGDTVRILHPQHQGEVLPVICKKDGLLFFLGVDGGIWPDQVELVRARTGNPCGTPCTHTSGDCRHCRGLCQQPYGECPPRDEAPVIVFTGPRW